MSIQNISREDVPKVAQPQCAIFRDVAVLQRICEEMQEIAAERREAGSSRNLKAIELAKSSQRLKNPFE